MPSVKPLKEKDPTDTVIEIFRIAEKGLVIHTFGDFSKNYKEEVKALLLNEYSHLYNAGMINELLKDTEIQFGNVLAFFLRYCLFVNADTTPVKPLPGIPSALLKKIFTLESEETAHHLSFLLGSPLSFIHKLPPHVKKSIVEDFQL